MARRKKAAQQRPKVELSDEWINRLAGRINDRDAIPAEKKSYDDIYDLATLCGAMAQKLDRKTKRRTLDLLNMKSYVFDTYAASVRYPAIFDPEFKNDMPKNIRAIYELRGLTVSELRKAVDLKILRPNAKRESLALYRREAIGGRREETD